MKEERFKRKFEKKIKALRRWYFAKYPDGDYMTIAWFKNSLLFNNRTSGDGEKIEIDKVYHYEEKADD